LFSVCPEGYFGDHCLNPCECDSENFICDPAKGCVCRVGYFGRDCGAPSAENVQGNEENSGGLGSAGAAVLLALLLVLLVVSAGLFYRHKKLRRKGEVAAVHYTVEKPEPSNFVLLYINILNILV